MNEPLKRIDHMVFNVKDLDKAIAFYTQVVGMKVTMKFDDRRMAFLSFGERFADLRLFEQGTQYDADRHWHGFNHVAFMPEGGRPALDRLEARLIDSGTGIESIEEYAQGRHRSVYFRDPENNRLEFYWESPSWIYESRNKTARTYRGESETGQDSGIDLFAWPTPNGIKASIMLKILDLPHKVTPIPLGPKAGARPDTFKAASATDKIPAIVDHDAGISMCESGAILMYLAERMTSPLLPLDPVARAEVLQWHFAVNSTFNPPMSEGRFYLLMNKGEAPLAEDRVGKQIRRSYATANTRLEQNAYLAAGALSIADISLWPYVARAEWQGIDIDDFPAVRDWWDRLAREEPAFLAGWDMFDTGEKPPRL